MKEIPVSTDTNFTQVTALSGKDYIFTFEWNAREEAWYVDIADQDAVPIVTSRKVVLGWPLIVRTVDPRCPPGVLMAVDRSKQDREATKDDFGSRVRLYYFEPQP